MGIKIDGIGIILFIYLSQFKIFIDVIEEMDRFVSTNLCNLSVPCSQHALIQKQRTTFIYNKNIQGSASNSSKVGPA